MDLTFDIVLIIHLVALGVGATTAIGMPIVMLRMRGATPETRTALSGIAARFGSNSRIAFVVLLLSGATMLWLRYGAVGAMSGWFWVKMALVGLVAVAMLVGIFAPRGAVNPAVLSWITRLSLLGVVIAAVLAFN